MAGKKLNGYKELTKKKELNKYLNPNIVYIPLINGNDEDVTILVSKDDYVYKNMMIAKTKGIFRISINSSISGVVLGIEERKCANGRLVKCLAIENDFKENVKSNNSLKKNIIEYSKDEFINILRECGIVGMGGASFPTYVKYDTDKKIKTLIVNAVECEPYITADYKLLMEKVDKILETVDAIMNINNIDEAIIAVKKINKEVINKINNYIGSYDKIKLILVPNKYPAGWERTLIKEVTGLNYTNLPIEQGIVVNNVSTIYAIYEALKYHKCITERIITFSGNMLLNPQNILVKIGTSIDELINKHLKLKGDNCDIVAGGPMMGNLVSKDLVVSANLNCVLFMKHVEECNLKECLRCGKCNNVCPARITPVLIKDNVYNKEVLKDMMVNRCVECGLCSYICPSKIDVRSFVRQAKKTLKEDK